MLAANRPRDAYRQSNFDARIKGGTAQDIVVYCLDELALTMGMLRQADLRGNRAGRSESITRGIAILTALEMGVDRAPSPAACCISTRVRATSCWPRPRTPMWPRSSSCARM